MFQILTVMDDKWEEKLTPEQYRVMRKKGTEAPFTGEYLHTKNKGIYKCAACGNELFSSDTKFDSGTGWPSFTDPTSLENVELKEDKSHGMVRTEVLCRKCGSHLGHVFDDLPADSASVATSAKGAVLTRAGGPAPHRGRYCINSVCLKFDEEK